MRGEERRGEERRGEERRIKVVKSGCSRDGMGWDELN